MTENANAKTVYFLTSAEGIEASELTEPWKAVTEAGHSAKLVSPEGGEVELVHHGDPAGTRTADLTLAEVDAVDIDALVLPGGVFNPDTLRQDKTAVALVKQVHEAGKPVAAICHAPWVLVEADLLRGRRATGYTSIETDVRNAGAEWVGDQEVVVDGNLITSRNPDDLPAFNGAVLEALEHGGAAPQG
ncbi:protease I [Kytococcus aerolatus]|uniref:Protease I n=1 Tax=Kytococcus aerolatus TaxID=592308 RepID=A0A212U0Z1_9MICO|nr:type 1 glutamine amidotransferase domain-containing protein [Kytococcus aerolatus]SNC71791.1 protease I [Kytococcus aerolatus]